MKTNVFVSFDFEHDRDLRDLLQVQGNDPDARFKVTDCSVEPLQTNAWKLKIRERIKRVDQVIFICGERTSRAKGVGLEFAITREEGKPYFLLQGRANKSSLKPHRAASSDKVYGWTPKNLQILISGRR